MEQLVSRPELESLLEAIVRRTPDPRAGIFGPGSITWKINREAALFLGAGRAALLQLAHPWVAGALAEHSSLLGDPIARFHNTFRIVFTMIFGSLDQALAAARYLHTLHTHIRGELRDPVARWPRGAHYEANEIDALRWVFATLIESAVLAYECVLPLSNEERDGYYNESKTMAALFGIPSSSLPENWSAFRGYTRGMVVSDTLGVDATARSTAHALLSGQVPGSAFPAGIVRLLRSGCRIACAKPLRWNTLLPTEEPRFGRACGCRECGKPCPHASATWARGMKRRRVSLIVNPELLRTLVTDFGSEGHFFRLEMTSDSNLLK